MFLQSAGCDSIRVEGQIVVRIVVGIVEFNGTGKDSSRGRIVLEISRKDTTMDMKLFDEKWFGGLDQFLIVSRSRVIIRLESVRQM